MRKSGYDIYKIVKKKEQENKLINGYRFPIEYCILLWVLCVDF